MIGDLLAKHLELVAGAVSDADRETLLGIKGDTCNLDKGEDILREGEHPTRVVIVLSGLLQRYKTNLQGARQIYSFYLPSDTPSLCSLHMDVMDHTLGAVAPSCVGLVDHAQLFRLMDAQPRLTALFWRETLVQAAIFREWLLRNSSLPAPKRTAHFFCEIVTRARAAGLAQGNTYDLPITQHDLADALGTSPIHANRTTMMLQAQEMATFKRGKLKVLDWNKLVKFAGFDPAYLHLRKEASRGAQPDPTPFQERISKLPSRQPAAV